MNYSISNESLTSNKKKRSGSSHRAYQNQNHENEVLLISTETESPRIHHRGSVKFVQNPHKSPGHKPIYTGFTSDTAMAATCEQCYDYNKEQRRLAKLLKAMNETTQKTNFDELVEFYRNKIKDQWIQLARIIDFLLLICFNITLFLLIAYILGMIYLERSIRTNDQLKLIKDMQ